MAGSPPATAALSPHAMSSAPQSSSDPARREVLGAMGLAALAPALAGQVQEPAAAAPLMQPKEYVLSPLPYPKNALDGFLSAEILELHHDKHHAGYVQGLNKAIADLAEARAKGNFDAVKAIARNLAFHGSGHVLHEWYWHSMSPKGGGDPADPALKQALEASFGSVDGFRKHFAAATKAGEASSWGILAYEPLGDRLIVLVAESHQQMGLHGAVPLIVCDVWEHAYYLRYQNRRGEYVDKFMDVIHWAYAAERLRAARA